MYVHSLSFVCIQNPQCHDCIYSTTTTMIPSSLSCHSHKETGDEHRERERVEIEVKKTLLKRYPWYDLNFQLRIEVGCIPEDLLCVVLPS